VSDPVKVLYIDDDAALGHLMRRALASKAILIEHVADPEEALAMLRGGGYHLVALDHDLGNTTGLALLERIQTFENAPPVIYVTGSDNARIAVAALKAGAVDYVWKDVEGHYRDLFVESVTAALRQQELKREKERAEQEIREARERAELLLREVNHRVANMLALISALARMQASVATDAAGRRMLLDMEARIKAIAGLHRRLYTSQDVRVVDLHIYLSALAQDLNGAIDSDTAKHRIKFDAERGIVISTDRAVSVGVVVTELVTNAIKYAYPDRNDGEVRIRLFRDREGLRLIVEDDGIGWAGRGDIQGTGIGSRVIKAMAMNLQCEVVYDAAHKGTRAIMEFSA
jgi:two-component sensor histidine kinase